jgi:uncharacterized protein (DUF433 family)
MCAGPGFGRKTTRICWKVCIRQAGGADPLGLPSEGLASIVSESTRTVEHAMGEQSTESGTPFDRITFEPGKMGGRACIRGLRITVGLIVSLIAEGASWEEILTDYPDVEAEDIRQALAYAAWLTREEIVSV